MKAHRPESSAPRRSLTSINASSAPRMLPSQDAIILSIATSVRLYAMCIHILIHPPQYLAGIGEKFGAPGENFMGYGVFNRLGSRSRRFLRSFLGLVQAA